jgi:hypothetical protein
MRLHRDPVHFTRPLETALATALQDVLTAGFPVIGAVDRVEAALARKHDLDAFIERVGDLLQARAFAALPELRHPTIPLRSLHQLTIGPWRGVFLVEPGGDEVIALLFTREPHETDLSRLIAEREAGGGGGSGP